jgi:phosphopantothenoylcysteine decarboxylase/phosphopantothenate--cysteine ligase
MAEPTEIRDEIERILGQKRDLTGVRVLVTAGPTYESIDPVRYLGNRSSGKMGYAVAEEARDRGATVTLISGPTALPAPERIELIAVESHAQMRREVLERLRDRDVVVMAAAIADFTPAAPSGKKIERQGALNLALTPTSDIAAEASQERPDALHIGFALETGDLAGRAREKMLRKGQAMVIANAIASDHNPFGSDTNRVTIITPEGTDELPPRSKREVAAEIWNTALRLRPHLRLEDGTNQ